MSTHAAPPFDLGAGSAGTLPAETTGLRVLLAHHGSADRRHHEEPLAGARRLWWS
ncbi:hypothetical protein [Lentzea sp. E54]|uniref:hypothetical protein n=1 Tax=Lentzea xerophila TaxID=3435883 RepID=UPI003DA506B4